MDFDSLKVSMNKTSMPKYDTKDYTKESNINTDKPSINNTNATTKKGIEKSDQLNKLASNNQSSGSNTVAVNQREKESIEDDYFKGSSYEEKLSKAMEYANQKLKSVSKQFSYEIHEATNQIIVKIEDSETGEILKEVPSEENLDMIAKMRELAGVLIDEKR